MSFCPSKDIHSVYLDNELPEAYKAEYEKHVASCPKCQKELNTLKALKGLLSEDSKSITPDSTYLDQSYERLMVKMAYSKNTGKIKKTGTIRWTYALTAAAAAAVFAVIIPVRTNTNISTAVVASAPITSTASVAAMSAIQNKGSAVSANNVSYDSGRNVLVHGNIPDTVISSESGRNNDSTLTKNVKEVEVLRPELEDETISIRITVPGIGEFPVTTEINVPMGVISGRF